MREADTAASAAEPTTDPPRSSRGRTVLRIGIRLLIVVVAISVAAFVLAGIFDDLNFAEIKTAIGRLSDAEMMALLMAWLMWIGAQGLQTASLVDGLPARRGVLAFIGPSAVASVIPGPTDLPVRYAMYQSWGTPPDQAAIAVGASGVFSIGSQLALPALAGIAIAVSGVEVAGFMTVIVTTTLVLAVVIVILALVLGSPTRTEAVGHRLDGLMRRGARLVRRTPPTEELGDLIVAKRAEVVDHLRDKWLPTTGATVLTVVAKCSILVMALRFVGIPETDLGWSAIFAVFALVAGLTVVPITPGSAGVSEIALVGMLAPIAGDAYVNEVAAGVLLYRILTWILLIPVGFAALGGWRLQVRRHANEQVSGDADAAVAPAGTPGAVVDEPR